MSNETDVREFSAVMNVLSHVEVEQMCLMRQLGASYEAIGKAVDLHPNTVSRWIRRREHAAQQYPILHARALRASYKLI